MFVNLQRKQGDCLIDITFNSATDSITALFGPSGSGKSSVVNMVAGLLKPDSGTISINGLCLFDSLHGINLPPEQRGVGYVFQEANLFPHISVEGNLLYGCNRKNALPLDVDFVELVDLLGLASILSRKPRKLSGGEKQRVAFGRAILSRPQILLMDEPLASLDTTRKEELLPFIKLLNARFKIPVLYVSHSLEEIHALTDKIIYLKNGKVAHKNR